MHRILKAGFKRLGLVHRGKRRARDLDDFVRDRGIDLVIDVGANTGQFGESLRAGGYQGKIVSFEPFSAAFQILKQKADADGNWEAHQLGLSAKEGSAALHVSELAVFNSMQKTTGVAQMHDRRMAVSRDEEIGLRTLDQVASGLTGTILLKIDTQGHERQVLEGGRQTLARSLGVMMELAVIHTYEGAWRFHEAVKYMEDAGFVPAQIEPVGFHGRDKVSAVEFDCLFRPRSAID
ncbi:MAG TPA: FkbM family methyltransferase [Terracidiphilus sp.]|nr:FkbM family methyltransferase [Terracidiphilus sp.]